MTTEADITRARNAGASQDAIQKLEEAYETEKAMIAKIMADSVTHFEPSTLEEFINDHFPEIEPGFVPFGTDVLIQLKTTQTTSKGGIVLAAATKEINDENTMVGRVIRLGPLAYRNRDTGALWPEGVWATPGTVVLVPKWGGFRFERTLPDGNKARFCIFRDLEIRGGLNEYFEGLSEIL